MIRIKAKTTKTIVQKNETKVDSIVFYDAEVRLGTEGNKNQSQTPVRLVGYHVGNADYWIATDRRDLTAEQIAEIYKLRWNIENFFAWWYPPSACLPPDSKKSVRPYGSNFIRPHHLFVACHSLSRESWRTGYHQKS